MRTAGRICAAGGLVLCGAQAPEVQAQAGDVVEVLRFEPPRGILSDGDTATARVVIRNSGAEPVVVWIGYSIGDAGGEWWDVPSHPVALPPGGVSEAVKTWVVPVAPVPGPHRAVVGIWSGPPEEPAGATRLAVLDAAGAFVVESRGTGFQRGVHALGRGRLRGTGVVPTARGFELRVEPGGCDGAEVRTSERYGRGTFSVRMRTPLAPGSLSAFFLYEDVPGGNDELDIEIYNDGSRRVLFTSWRGGRITQQTIGELPFDPSEGFHEYSITRMKYGVEMRIDGTVYASWRRGMPESRMRVMANLWWPTWLECGTGAAGVLELEGIEIRPEEDDLR